MYNFLEETDDEHMKAEFDKAKEAGLDDTPVAEKKIAIEESDDFKENIIEQNIAMESAQNISQRKDTSSILYTAPFNDEDADMTKIQKKSSEKALNNPISELYLEELKVGKNYLFTKEATEIIIENYDDLVVKNEFLNYLIENLTEYYMLDDFDYINDFLFPEEETSLSKDLIKSILNQKRSLLFNYYMSQVFQVVDDETRDFNYIEGIIYILQVNPTLTPIDVKKFYDENLKSFLRIKEIEETEEYYELVKSSFKRLHNTGFEKTFYKEYFLPSLKVKIKNEPIETMHKLKLICNLIIKYPELKYNRQSRILFTTYNLLNAKNNYYSYDEDIMYDVQSYVEEILMNDQILDYNLIYFCSYFDGNNDYRKSLNLVINILEGVKTISLSRTKYELIKEQTIDESLSYLEWVLINHHRDTSSDEFRIAIKDFIAFNWEFFTDNNKSFIQLKSSLRNYSKLDEVIEEVKGEQKNGMTVWYQKYGAFTFSIIATITFFALTCLLGVTFLNSYLSSISGTFVLVMIILLEIIIAGFLVLIMIFDKDKH